MKNLCELLQESSNRYPDHIYIQDKNVNYTYQEVFHRVRTMASILTNKYQISANDCVMLYIENSVEYVIAFFSVLYIGATAVPLNTNLGSDLFQLVSEETKSKYIISSRQLIGKAKKSLPETVSNIMMNLEELRDSTSLKNESIKMNSTAEVAMIIYTSGTTSKAKGVMLSHENLLTNTDSILSYLPINNKSVILAIMSFTYSYGNSILLTHTKAGGCIKIYNMSAYPQKVLEELKTVNSFSTVGSYLNTLVKQSNFDASSFKGLEYMTFAGEATSYDLIEHLQHELPDVRFYIMYGQTEASARLSYLEPSMLSKKKGSVGKAIKGVEIKIVDSNDAEVPCEETGEIIVKGKNVMKGYINDSALTDEILRSGWLHTGDIAYKDQEGYLYIVGRCKDIIKRSGYRISPVEIESVLNQYESVLESAVVEDYGENQEAIIKAYIVLKPECLKFSLDELKIFVNHSLPMIKRPQVYEIVPKIPKTMNGKIRRTQLRRG